MFTDYRLLVVQDKTYILGAVTKESYHLLGAPRRIGNTAIAFANADFTHIADLSRFKEAINNCDMHNNTRLQEIIMMLIDTVEENDNPDWIFEIERIKLQKLDQEIYRAIYRYEDLCQMLQDVLSYLESLIEFQTQLKKILYEFSLADKKASCHASNAQILCRLFKEFPSVCNLCFGQAGYMIVNIDSQGNVRTETLDFAQTNRFRLLLKPDSIPLTYNDINDTKTICEYHIVDDIQMCIMFDLIEGLRGGKFFAQCSTCRKFFFTTDRRRTYCSNTACSSKKARMQKRNNKISEDPILKEAYRYKNAMCSRYQRSINRKTQGNYKKSVSFEEYDAWTTSFRNALAKYTQEKSLAVLSGADQNVIDEIGTRFLDKIRPADYVSNFQIRKQ